MKYMDMLNDVELTNEVVIMKKNNSFMLAYIIFIFVANIVKYFWEYPMWNTIVVSITVVSSFFAVSDFFLAGAKLYENLKSSIGECIETALDEITQIKKLLDKRLSQSDDFVDSKLYTKQEQVEHYNDSKRRVEHIESDMVYYQGRMKSYAIYSYRFRKSSEFLNIIGFILLFCIMGFEPVANFFCKDLDGTTVSAFGVILVTQYIENTIYDKIGVLRENFEKNTNALDAIRKTYESEVLHIGT